MKLSAGGEIIWGEQGYALPLFILFYFCGRFPPLVWASRRHVGNKRHLVAYAVYSLIFLGKDAKLCP